MGFAGRLGPLSTVCLLLSCCSDCARDGCDALSRLATMNGDGIAGAVAVESDAVVDGCAECSLSSADIEVWPLASPVSSSSEALAITDSGPPQFSLTASENYVLELAAGTYLFCVRPNCAVVRVTAGVTTVNVKRREGPPSFFVAEPPASNPVETFGVEIGYETN